MASKVVKVSSRYVTPVFSTTKEEAKRRVLNLYKAWYRHVPSMVLNYDIQVTVPQCRKRLREEFMKNKDVTDIRVVDMLVIKGQMELVETTNVWKTKNHIMDYISKPAEYKPKDFLTKFYDGLE